MDNLRIWKNVSNPPKQALKKIVGGDLGAAGMTDINPQWRYRAMTEQFGPCGIGWKFQVVKIWSENASDGQFFAFAEVNVYVKDQSEWSEPIPGIGGSMLIVNQKRGPKLDDEAYKKAVTDALGTAMKMIGIGAEVYSGFNDSKYSATNQKTDEAKPSNDMTDEQKKAMKDVWLFIKDYKAAGQTNKAFGEEIVNTLKAEMGELPDNPEKTERANEILNDKYNIPI